MPFAITGTTGRLGLQCCVSPLKKVGPITHHQDRPVGAALSLGLARVSGPSHCALLAVGTLFIVAGMNVTNAGPVARASCDQVFKAAALPPWGTCMPMVLGHLGLARFTEAECLHLTGRLDLPLVPLYLMAPLPQDSQRSFPDS